MDKKELSEWRIRIITDDVDLKIGQFKDTLKLFNENTSGERYWIDLRVLILLTHLFIEHFLNKIVVIFLNYKVPRVNKEGFHWKIEKLHENDVIDGDLYVDLGILNEARNSIAHNLKIIGRLDGVSTTYLSIKHTKEKSAELMEEVSKILKEVTPKEKVPSKDELTRLW